MRRQRDIEPRERVDVVTAREAERQAGRSLGDLMCVGHLTDRVDVLVAEPEPEPRVDERGVGRRHHRVVRGEALRDPALGRDGVEVAHELRLRDGMARGVDPDVRAPARVARPPIRNPATSPPGDGGDARGAVGADEDLLDLLAGRGCVLVARVEARLDEPLRPVPLREQPRGAVEMLARERDDSRGSVRDGADHSDKLDGAGLRASSGEEGLRVARRTTRLSVHGR